MKPGYNQGSRILAAWSRVDFSQADLSQPSMSGAVSRCCGFSMIELLVVVVVLVVLTTLMWAPRTGRRENARLVACKSQLERVFIAMQIYANECGSRFPRSPGAKTAGEALQVLVPRYTSDTASLICPGSKFSLKPDQPLNSQKISYSYYSGLQASDTGQPLITDEQLASSVPAPARFQFSGDGKPPGTNHGKQGGNVLFCDGHVEMRTPGAPLPKGMPEQVTLLNP